MIIQQGTLSFPSHKNNGPQITEQALNFASAPQSTIALLSGFDVQFVEKDEDKDHHVHLIDLDLRTRSLSAHSVEIAGQLGLRDRSKHWDDPYAGMIRYVLFGVEAGDQALGGTLNFPMANDHGPRTLTETVHFSNHTNASVAALTGLTARFSDDDNHLLQLEADVDGQSTGPSQMQVYGTYGLRDSSNNWDDEYDGIIRYAALGSTIGDKRSIEIRTGRIDFSPGSGSGPRESSTSISFANPVGNCAAVLTGFLIGFDKEDKHLQRAIIEVEARKLSNTEIEVVGKLGLKDQTESWDDDYRGWCKFAVIGEAAV